MPSPPHLLLTFDFPPMRGGIARYMAEVTRRYPPGRLVVSTGTVDGAAASDASMPNRVDRLHVDAQQLRTAVGLLQWSRRARALARSSGAAFSWCGNIRPAAYPADWVRRREGVPYGIIFHGSDVLKLRLKLRGAPVKRGIYRRLFANAAVLAPNSGWTRDQCLGVLDELRVQYPADRVRTVPLGTDPAQFRPGLDTANVRARFGLPAGRWLISVARLQAEKGIDTALAVVAALAGECPELRYLVVVVGSADRVPDYESLAVRLGVRERVHFVDRVTDEELPVLLNVGEIFLGLSRRSPLWEEGFGIALTEAEACGLPVVAGRSGGTGDAVRDGETGFIVDAESPEAATAAVRTLLCDPAMARRMGAAGRRMAETYWNWDRVVADLDRIGLEFGRR